MKGNILGERKKVPKKERNYAKKLL